MDNWFNSLVIFVIEAYQGVIEQNYFPLIQGGVPSFQYMDFLMFL